MVQQIEIKENKKRQIVALVVLMVLLGGVLGILGAFVFPFMAKMPTLKYTIVAIVVVLPMFAVYAILKRVLSSEPALIINEEGITDNAAQTGVGFVPWSDIIDFKEASNFVKQKLLLFYVRNPIDYLSKINGFKNGVLTAHYNQFGTPVVINLFDIAHDHVELKEMIETVFQRVRESAGAYSHTHYGDFSEATAFSRVTLTKK